MLMFICYPISSEATFGIKVFAGQTATSMMKCASDFIRELTTYAVGTLDINTARTQYPIHRTVHPCLCNIKPRDSVAQLFLRSAPPNILEPVMLVPTVFHRSP